MEPELAALAHGVGAALVAAMATDAWSRAREGATLLWRRVQPRRAELVTAEMEESHTAVRAAEAQGDEAMLAELRAQWQGELRRLLLASPEAAAELRALLDLLAELPGHAAAAPAVTQHATATGHGRVYQAGRDQHIAEG